MVDKSSPQNSSLSSILKSTDRSSSSYKPVGKRVTFSFEVEEKLADKIKTKSKTTKVKTQTEQSNAKASKIIKRVCCSRGEAEGYAISPLTLKISDSEMNDEYTKYLRNEVKNFGLTLLLMLAVTTAITFLFYLMDEEEKIYLWISIYLGSSTIMLAMSFVTVVVNGEKFVDLFGPCIIGAMSVSIIAMNSSNLLDDADV